MKVSHLCILATVALESRAFVLLNAENAGEAFKKPCPGKTRWSNRLKATHDADGFLSAPVEKTTELEDAYLSTAWTDAIQKTYSAKYRQLHDSLAQRVMGDDDGNDDHPSPPDHPHDPPHHGPPHHDPDHDPHHGPPHHGPPHHGPGHGIPPGHDFTNGTIYEALTRSPYTSKILELIDQYDDIVDILNSTKQDITFFCPTNEAFEKIPDHGKKPSKEFIKALLTYHVGEHPYTARDVFYAQTLESKLSAPDLGDKKDLQRIRVSRGFRGIYLNLFSRIIYKDFFASNGLIHGIDHLLVPPPRAYRILEILPGEFSTLVNALYKTKVIDEIKDSSEGLTVFAPTNDAFKRLGPRILAFLFSPMGEKYLTALIKYHIVKGSVLYTDAYLHGKDEKDSSTGGHDHHSIPKGRYHVDLETLSGRHLSVDLARYGFFVKFQINGFNDVYVANGIAEDGAVHIPHSVLIPPKKLGSGEMQEAADGLSLEEFKERLEPLL